MSTRSSDEVVRALLHSDPDFVLARRHDDSLVALLRRHEDGLSDRAIAQALGMSAEEVAPYHEALVEKLRLLMGV